MTFYYFDCGGFLFFTSGKKNMGGKECGFILLNSRSTSMKRK